MFVASYRNTEAGIRKRKESDEVAVLRANLTQTKRDIDEMMAKLDELSGKDRPAVYRSAFHRLEVMTCRLFGYSRAELHANSRDKRVVFARHFLMYWACRRTTLSLPQIGRLMGGRDHTTILHGKDTYVVRREQMGRKLRRAR